MDERLERVSLCVAEVNAMAQGFAMSPDSMEAAMQGQGMPHQGALG